jgi:hypothetical protein
MYLSLEERGNEEEEKDDKMMRRTKEEQKVMRITTLNIIMYSQYQCS